jgi:hypothetical protein
VLGFAMLVALMLVPVIGSEGQRRAALAQPGDVAPAVGIPQARLRDWSGLDPVSWRARDPNLPVIALCTD